MAPPSSEILTAAGSLPVSEREPLFLPSRPSSPEALAKDPSINDRSMSPLTPPPPSRPSTPSSPVNVSVQAQGPRTRARAQAEKSRCQAGCESSIQKGDAPRRKRRKTGQGSRKRKKPRLDEEANSEGEPEVVDEGDEEDVDDDEESQLNEKDEYEVACEWEVGAIVGHVRCPRCHLFGYILICTDIRKWMKMVISYTKSTSKGSPWRITCSISKRNYREIFRYYLSPISL